MLPLDLLIARIKKGSIQPIYAEINQENLEVATQLLGLFQASIGRKKKELLEQVSSFEVVGFDYRFIRGLSTIHHRLSIFEKETAIDPLLARRILFEEASRRGFVASVETRSRILSSVAHQLGLSEEQLEETFRADLDDELVLKESRTVSPSELLKMYNLSLTQTLLLRSTYVKVRVSDHWKEILRSIKFRGLMYSAETKNGQFQIVMDGPSSLMKFTQRYGASLAKLLPLIVVADNWEINSSIVRSGLFGKRIFQLRLTSHQVGEKIKPVALRQKGEKVTFDSSVEKKFFKDFQSLGSGWKLEREPTPLIAGRHVFIPDFSFEKRGIKVYFEIVGFWTKTYLENKIRKLRLLENVDIIIAANELLACERLKRLKGEVIFYKKHVPLRPILEMLGNREKAILQREIQGLNLARLELDKEVVELREIAEKFGVSDEALRRKLKEVGVERYSLTGGVLVSDKKLEEIEMKITSLPTQSLSEVIRVIEQEGIGTPYDVISALNYSVRWNGLDLDKSQIYRKKK